MKRHKHADLIHAWAEGSEIQRRLVASGYWADTDPIWDEDAEYRIKPSKPLIDEWGCPVSKILNYGRRIFCFHPDEPFGGIQDLMKAARRGSMARDYDLGCAMLAEYMAAFIDNIKPEVEETKPLIDEETRKAIKKLFPDASWLAMDEDGEAVLYMEQPNYTKSSYYWNAMGSESWTVGGLDNYATDWRTSLVDLNQEVESGRSTKGDSVDLNEEVK